MVLEALTALSLAGTIIQFLDFGAKLLAHGHEFDGSVNSPSIQDSDIDAVAGNLRDFIGRLNASAVPPQGEALNETGAPTKSEVALLKLAKKCSTAADELLAASVQLTVEGSSGRRWRSFRQAFKSAFSHGRVDEIDRHLKDLRQELNFNVLVSLREDLDLQAVRASAGFLSLERSTQVLANQLIQDKQRALSNPTSPIESGQATFMHILERLDPVYLEQSSRIFQIFALYQQVKTTPLTSLELSFAEERDSDFVMREPTRKRSVSELLKHSSRVELWLKTRCGGLIKTYGDDDSSAHVATWSSLSYLHRKVRDFLELPEVWSIVVKPTSGTEFVPSVALLQSQVLYIKWVLPFPTTLIKRVSVIHRFSKRAIFFARLAETATKRAQLMMLDELDRVCKDLIRDLVPDAYSWTTELHYSSDFEFEPSSHQSSFLALAVKCGLRFYVSQKLKLEPWLVENKGGRPLLHYALSDNNELFIAELEVNSDMVALLFKNGAKVDEAYEGITAWELVLQSIFLLLGKQASESTVTEWLSIVKLFLEHGADPAQCIGNDSSKLAYSLVNALSDSPHEVKSLLVSPGTLAERAEEARRIQRAVEFAQTRQPWDETEPLDDSPQLLSKTEDRYSPSPSVTLQIAQPAVVPSISSSNGMESEAEEVSGSSPKTESAEAQTVQPLEVSEFIVQSELPDIAPKTTASTATQSVEPAQDLQSPGQKPSPEVHENMINPAIMDQSPNSTPVQVMPSQEVPGVIPPPLPPKIPIIVEACYELEGRPVQKPRPKMVDASQQTTYLPWVPPPSPVPTPSEEEEVPSQIYRSVYSPYPRSTGNPQPRPRLPSSPERNNHSPSGYFPQQTPDRSSRTPHINTSYAIENRHRQGSDSYVSPAQSLTSPSQSLSSPSQWSPRSNPYPSPQSNVPTPSSATTTRYYQQFQRGNRNSYVPAPSPRSPPISSPNRDPRDARASWNGHVGQYQPYSPPYPSGPPPSQQTAPSPQKSPGPPPQQNSPVTFEPTQRPESAPGKKARPRWVDRLSKSFRT